MKRGLILFVVAGVIALIFYTRRPDSAPNNAHVSAQQQSSPTTIRDALTRSKTTSERTTVPDLQLLKSALQAGNFADVESVMVKLTYYLKERPELLTHVLDDLKNELDTNYLTYLTKVIEEGGALTNKLVAETALDIAKTDTAAVRQHAALSLLGKIPDVSPEMSKTVRQLARDANDPQVRNSAVATMANWMNDHPSLSIELNNDLLAVAKTAQNPEVRGNALQVIGVHLEGLPGTFTTEMAEQLQGDTFSRAIAARALASAPASMRDFVLPKLQDAFQVESDPEIRRVLLSSIVHSGRGETVAILERFSNDPVSGPDVRDYLEILRKGITEPAEIMRQKNLLDEQKPHPRGTDQY